jgi:N6-L-threonylcarbamoyladenine synthase
MGLPYPGGPHVDRLAKTGDSLKFEFSRPRVKGLDYSFSGLKTNFLYFLRDRLKENENFIDENLNDLCASIQYTIVEILLGKLKRAAKETGVKEITVAGGVSANSGLRNALKKNAEKYRWNLVIPKFEYTMDNAAMIAITGYYKYLNEDFVGQNVVPFARTQL